MPSPQDELRGEIFGGAAQRVGFGTAHQRLGKPKVDEFGIACAVDQTVLGFQIPICDALLMQVAWENDGDGDGSDDMGMMVMVV